MFTRIRELTVLAVSLAVACDATGKDSPPPFRPPAVPLAVSDPYLSVWSEADHLTDDVTRHWTHHPHPLVSLIRVDGVVSRLMGPQPDSVPAMPQKGVEVTPTRSIYDFENSKVHVTLTFMTPALPNDLDVLSRPVTYLTWTIRSIDGITHAVSVFDSASSLLAVNQTSEQVSWSRQTVKGGMTSRLLGGGLTVLRAGTTEQPILGSSGDDHRIDWGYVLLAAPSKKSQSAIGESAALMKSYLEMGELPAVDDCRMPRAANEDEPAMAFVLDFESVGPKPESRHVLLSYDEVCAVRYFGRNLPPYWRRNGITAESMLQEAEKDYSRLAKDCEEFDQRLMDDLAQEGGARYARIAALAYREALGGCGLAADSRKQPLFFTKENGSDGDIATVDVIFPMEPVLLLLSPSLAKSALVPVLSYAESHHWKFPNAPHDLGFYPLATGRDDGGEGMPVEESGNMLILCDAIAHVDGNAGFAARWWPQLRQWAKYLEQYGLDPEDQLCTDDFMGHLAHQANLSIKAILGLAAYGDLCRMRGDSVGAKKYMDLAREDAAHWIVAAEDGDHYRLAFDQAGTWSQKYNLVWDKILGLHVFPPEVAAREIAEYKKVMQPYGLPLDSRTHLTKTDWTFWTATLSENRADFESLTSPFYDYLNKTIIHDPLVDSYYTDNLEKGGFHARPVVGGVFIKMLADEAMWKKWSARDSLHPSNWAPLPGETTAAK